MHIVLCPLPGRKGGAALSLPGDPGSRASETKMKTLLVVGLGNVLRGDDGAGAYACLALARRWARRSGWAVRRGDGAAEGPEVEGGRVRVRFLEGILDPFAVLEAVQAPEVRRCLVLDAVRAGLSPGETVRWELRELEKEGGSGVLASLHGVDLLQVLELGRLAGLGRGPRLVVWGIQADPGCLWGRRLSPSVGRGLRSLVLAAERELAEWVRAERAAGAADA